jgi:hypothetical protein
MMGIRYQLEKVALNKTSGVMSGYYICSTTQTTGCKARFIDKGDGTIHCNSIEHVCNQFNKRNTALEREALCKLSSAENSKFLTEATSRHGERIKKTELDERNNALLKRENEGLREEAAAIAAAKLAAKSANQVLAVAKAAVTLEERITALREGVNEGFREKLAAIGAAKLAVKSANQVLSVAKLAAECETTNQNNCK